MTYQEELDEPSTLAPEEAFAVLGDETRVQILRALGEADEPLAFSDLYDRVQYDTTANFNYHLDRLEGHFVRKTDEGYTLHHAGRYVIQAVLSGAVTDASVLEPTGIDQTCPRCEGRIEVRYHQGHVELFCTECDGTFGRDEQESDRGEPDRKAEQERRGYLGCLMLPPAGLEGRTTEEAFRAAWTWMRLKSQAIAAGICPSCSAPLERWVDVCERHDGVDGLCEVCDRRYAVLLGFDCTNCTFDGEGDVTECLSAETDLLAFLTDHGLNPVAPSGISDVWRVLTEYDEVVRSTDPFEVEVTFSVDGDALTLTVGDDLSVVDASRHEAAETVR